MPESSPDSRDNRSARYDRSDLAGTFEALYEAAARGDGEIPWDRDLPSPLVVEWLANHPLDATGKTAIVVGCGLGNDAELIAARGFATTAFDISPTALRLARERYPESVVDYRQADLLDLPQQWLGSFDLVIESITVQAMPIELHERAAAAVASLVGIGGLLAVFSGARVGEEIPDGPPWPLTGEELGYFAVGGVERAVVETIPAPKGRLRWRAEYRRPDPEHDKDRTTSHWL